MAVAVIWGLVIDLRCQSTVSVYRSVSSQGYSCLLVPSSLDIIVLEYKRFIVLVLVRER